MNSDSIKDEQLRHTLRRAYDKQERKFDDVAPSFQELWSRARAAHTAAPQIGYPAIWFRMAISSVLALVAVTFVFQRHLSEPLPMFAAQLRLPTDGLLKAAERFSSMNLTQPTFPSDSLKWRDQ